MWSEKVAINVVIAYVSPSHQASAGAQPHKEDKVHKDGDARDRRRETVAAEGPEVIGYISAQVRVVLDQ